MLPEDEQLVRTLFTEAIVLSPTEWTAFVAGRTESAEVRAAVQRLLSHHVSAGEFLSKPAVQSFPLMSSPFGSALEEFRIIRELGRGGMGVVYLAEDIRLKRGVALKVMHSSADSDGSYSQRFTREAQTVARLSHPGIIKVFRTGQQGDFAFIAMEYVEGQTLQQRLNGPDSRAPNSARRTGPTIEPRAVALLVAEVAEALDHAHRHEVIHRDVKPSNILIDTEGHARLTDFGIARVVSERTITTEGNLTGSVPYMSPEQARVSSAQIDHRTDVFSLGVVLYEGLTGRRPFDGPSPEAILHALMTEDPVPVLRLNRSIPRDLAVICHKAIEKSVRDRYQSAAAVAADLRTALAGGPILAGPPSPWRRLKRFAVRRRKVLAASTFVALLSVIVASLLIISRYRENEFAWLRIEAADREVTLHLYPCDSLGTPIRGQARLLGNAPVEQRDLVPGQYQLLVSDRSNTSFAEFNLHLLDRGELGRLVVRIVGPDERHSTVLPKTLFAVLRPTSDVVAGMLRVPRDTYHLNRVLEGRRLFSDNLIVDEFFIDSVAVSNRAYKRFLDATGHPPPARWASDVYSDEIAERPVTWVSSRDAEAYARWVGKRLPTLTEWMAATRGRDGRLYPWGDEPPSETPPDLGDFDQSADLRRLQRDYLRLVVPVTQPAAWDVPGGLLHSFSNVREFTATLVSREQGVYTVGRAWSNDPRTHTLATVRTFPVASPGARIGFRCAKSAEPNRSNP